MLTDLVQVCPQSPDGNHCHSFILDENIHLGVSENSVPLNPMVNDHYPY